MFFFAVLKAEVDLMSAFASVDDSGVVATAFSEPLEGDMIFVRLFRGSNYDD